MTRLRNRIRKADYFTDGELLRWHRDKRTTYTGLWAIAEDSGCLEDDPFMWKVTIWSSPLDADITVELLTQWRDELVEAQKLIPYEADGKPYLFIRTFHQHELPKNPAPPDLPLPEWVELVKSEGVGRDNKRWVRYRYVDHKYTKQNRYGLCTDSLGTPLPRPALPRVPKGTRGVGGSKRPVDISTVRPLAVDNSPSGNGHGGIMCWRCGTEINGGKPVESRKGLRHEECPK